MKWVALMLVLVGLSGCSSFHQLKKYPESPQVYGGVRKHVQLFPFGHMGGGPSGHLEGHLIIFSMTFWWIPFDIILSAAVDTVVLPATIPAVFLYFDEQTLLEALRSGEPDDREDAAERLADMGSYKAVPILVEIFLRSEAPVGGMLRQGSSVSEIWESHYSLRAIKKIGHEGIISALDDSNQDLDILEASRNLLGLMMSEPGNFVTVIGSLEHALRSYNPEIKIQVGIVLRSVGDEGDRILRDGLWSANPEVRAVCATMLDVPAAPEPGAGVKEHIASLILALQDPSATVRAKAAWGLSQFGERAKMAGSECVKLLRDVDEEVRHAAAGALRQIKWRPAIPDLLARLRDEKEAGGVRGLAAEALGAINYNVTAVLPTLLDQLENEDDRISLSCSSALAAIGEPAVPGLIKKLSDPSWHITMITLEEIGQPALPLLRKVVESDSDANRRSAASKVIQRIEDHES